MKNKLDRHWKLHTNYLVNYLVCPHQQDAHQRGLGLSGLIHEEAHPTASNFS